MIRTQVGNFRDTESVVECLEECKPSEQKDYFLASTVKWRALGCDGTEEELQEREYAPLQRDQKPPRIRDENQG